MAENKTLEHLPEVRAAVAALSPEDRELLAVVQAYTFTPSVSAEGVISWTNDGDLENPTPVNIKGPAGATGAPGTPGAKGADGKTPVKGTDYFTAADKAELVQAVLTALPDGDGATYG